MSSSTTKNQPNPRKRHPLVFSSLRVIIIILKIQFLHHRKHPASRLWRHRLPIIAPRETITLYWENRTNTKTHCVVKLYRLLKLHVIIILLPSLYALVEMCASHLSSRWNISPFNNKILSHINPLLITSVHLSRLRNLLLPISMFVFRELTIQEVFPQISVQISSFSGPR